jgi:hypothetical protein
VLGYTFGNHNEAELLGKLRESMDPGDYLLLDARPHLEGTETGQRLTKELKAELTRGYNHALNNRFAFGPVEATTIADWNSVQFLYDVNRQSTAVPNSLNIVTHVENLQTKFRRTGGKLNKKRIDLAVTTIYEDSSLGSWFTDRGFELIWKKKVHRTGFYLLRKATI